jgi:DNA-directed RNA polymerase subunit RPC12/RpoP
MNSEKNKGGEAMETEAFECGKCGERYDVPVGEKKQCPACGHVHLADGE